MVPAKKATTAPSEPVNTPLPLAQNIINSDEIEVNEVPLASAPGPVLNEELEDGATPIIITASDEMSASQLTILQKREDARGQLAVVFTVATFVLFALGFILVLFSEGNKIENFKDVILTISGIFSGLLGFVVGYYFRKGEGN